MDGQRHLHTARKPYAADSAAYGLRYPVLSPPPNWRGGGMRCAARSLDRPPRGVRWRAIVRLVLAWCTLALVCGGPGWTQDNALVTDEFLQGQRLLSQGRYQEAIPILEEAIHLNSTLDAIYHNLGLAYRKTGQYDQAVAAYHSAIRLDPDHAPSHYGIGFTYNAMGQYDKAIAPLREAVRLNASHDAAYHNLGLAYRETAQYEQAIAAYEEAIRLDPTFAPSHFGLGFAYWQLGDDAQAIQAFQKTIRLQPNHAAAHYNLGLALRRAGHTRTALKTLQRYLSIAGNQPDQRSWVVQARELVKRLASAVAAMPGSTGVRNNDLSPAQNTDVSPTPLSVVISSHDTVKTTVVPARTSRVTIRGHVPEGNPGVQVTIDGKQVGLDDARRFAGVVLLSTGDNLITVAARDRRGNEARRTVTIHRASTAALPPAAPQRRHALVIGNSVYKEGRLANPAKDATDMASVLKRLNFTVTLLVNANKQAMDQAIERFTNTLRQGGVGVFYYAGHGVQIEGVNFLVPVGARLEVVTDVKYRAVQVGWILERMEEARNRLNIIILDACRDNPFARRWKRSLAKGLATTEVGRGSLIAYATGPGKTAEDGRGNNSPYTKHLLRYINVPGLNVEAMFKRVREEVDQETSGKQTPWIASSLLGEFYFAGRNAVPATSRPIDAGHITRHRK